MRVLIDEVCVNEGMPERSSNKPRAWNYLAAAIGSEAIGELPLKELNERDPRAVALVKKRGAMGRPARAAKLSPERRREIAQRAARVP